MFSPTLLFLFILFLREQNDIFSNMKDLLKLIDLQGNIPKSNNNIERDWGGGIYNPFFKFLPGKSSLLKSERFGRCNCKFSTYNSVLQLSTYNSALLRECGGVRNNKAFHPDRLQWQSCPEPAPLLFTTK